MIPESISNYLDCHHARYATLVHAAAYTIYYFCSAGCRTEFADNPEGYGRNR